MEAIVPLMAQFLWFFIVWSLAAYLVAWPCPHPSNRS